MYMGIAVDWGIYRGSTVQCTVYSALYIVVFTVQCLHCSVCAAVVEMHCALCSAGCWQVVAVQCKDLAGGSEQRRPKAVKLLLG